MLDLFSDELTIQPEEGFTAANDIFGRRDFAERLTRLISQVKTPCVLLLDAPWGMGKTTFVKMWQGQMFKDNHIRSIYFDAFANDYQKDAFLALASRIISEAEKVDSLSSKKFAKTALRVAKTIGRASLKIGVRALSAGAADLSDIEDVTADILKDGGEVVSDMLDEVLKERLESHAHDEKVFAEFRRALSELVIKLDKASVENGDNQVNTPPRKPLLFIIDELDRCRPDFALEVLEKIKHFFNVPNVIFLLVSTIKQLESAVRYAYGTDNPRTYLEKFYHLRILMPTDNNLKPNLATTTYLQKLQCSEQVVITVSQVAKLHNFSLRTLERIAAYINLAKASFARMGDFDDMIAILAILKVAEPGLYENARMGQLSFLSLNDFVGFDRWRHPNNSSTSDPGADHLRNYWKLFLGDSLDEEIRRDLLNRLSGSGLRNAGYAVKNVCDLLDGYELPEARSSA